MVLGRTVVAEGPQLVVALKFQLCTFAHQDAVISEMSGEIWLHLCQFLQILEHCCQLVSKM